VALASGPDSILAAKTLEAARANHALNLSKNAFALSATGGYGVNEGFSFSSPSTIDSSLLSKAGTSNAGAYNALQAGLTLSKGASASPFTKLALSVTENAPFTPSQKTQPLVLALSLSQTLWDGYPGGQARATVDKSALSLQGKELQAAQSRSLIVANVKKAYLTLLTAQRAFSLKGEIAKKQHGLLGQITAIYGLKQASSIDLLNAQINAKSADLDVETARHDLELARQRLANILGLPPDSSIAAAEAADEPLPAASLEEALAKGLSGRPELALSDLNRRSSAIDLALARGQAQPGVSLSGGLNTALAFGIKTSDADYATVAVKLSLPVLDAGAAAAQTASSSALVDYYATQRRQLELSIGADIKDSWWLMTIQSGKAELARQSMELAEAQLALVKTQNSYGTATNQDFLAAAVNAANAETAYGSAKNAYLLSVLALETAMGQ
jgi:outer membrane protein TolC